MTEDIAGSRPATLGRAGREPLVLLEDVLDQLARHVGNRPGGGLNNRRHSRAASANARRGVLLGSGHCGCFLTVETTRTTRHRSTYVCDCNHELMAHNMKESHDSCGRLERQRLLLLGGRRALPFRTLTSLQTVQDADRGYYTRMSTLTYSWLRLMFEPLNQTKSLLPSNGAEVRKTGQNSPCSPRAELAQARGLGIACG